MGRGEAAVGGERAGLDFEQLEMTIEQLLDGGRRCRAALLVDLDEQPAQRLLCLGGGCRPGGDDLADTVPSFRQRVDARVHRDAKRAARQLLDLPAIACPSSCHGVRVGLFAPRPHPWPTVEIAPAECFRWSGWVDLVAAYSNRPDVLGDLEYTLAALAKAQAAAGRIEPVSVRSDRSTRSWKVSHRLSEEDVQLLTKEYRAGALRQELADKYKISLSSVGRLLRKHEARLKDNLP